MIDEMVGLLACLGAFILACAFVFATVEQVVTALELWQERKNNESLQLGNPSSEARLSGGPYR